MQFEINETEMRYLKRWKEFLSYVYKINVSNSDLEFTFYVTGIGNAIKVRHPKLGISVNITDYESW